MGVRTIGLIVTLVLGLLAAPLLAEAQQAGKMEFHSTGSYFIASRISVDRGLVEGLNDLMN